MKVYDDAHRLAKSIKDSEEYKDYMAKRNKVMEDEKQKEMVDDFRKKAIEIQMEQLSGKEVSKEKTDKLEKLQDVLMLNPIIKDFFISEMRLSQMISDVYKILEEAINIDDDVM